MDGDDQLCLRLSDDEEDSVSSDAMNGVNNNEDSDVSADDDGSAVASPMKRLIESPARCQNLLT
jgi:hypothetical protein